MKPRRPAIFRFVLQAHAVAISGMSDSEAGKWFRSLLRDLESGNPSSDVAREMIEERNHVLEFTRRGGLASARRRAGISDEPNVVSASIPVRPSTQSSVPDKSVFMTHAATIGLPESEAEQCWKYWVGAGWAETDGKPVENWRKKLMNWKMDHQQKRGFAHSAAARKPTTANLPEKATYAPDDPLFGEQALAATKQAQ